MNQVNTHQTTTARWTTNLRDSIELYFLDPLPLNYDFYTSDVEIKKKFEQKFIDYYYFEDFEWDQLALFKHHFKSLMNLNAPNYKVMFENMLSENDLINVDIQELTDRSKLGVNSAESSASNTNQSESSADSSNIGKDFDTPQGNINMSNLSGYVSGVSDNKGESTSIGSMSGTSQGTSSNTDTESVNDVKTIKGYRGNKTLAELKSLLINTTLNIDKMIINDCEKLFLKIK